ncbi:OmpH family outer membrane protein [Luteolibacter luteus]|uniref:OmpH family outer membrane protein n=1 Tax=Luteolibacter luteus TaxID=2728835 RepID=A0A858REY1_9BACT|nr:OmpH family outer membrane protein [Luteolibacter luteus]QJE94860.1 OmpH family outer membrane protein [Luteolibacter luteus]
MRLYRFIPLLLALATLSCREKVRTSPPSSGTQPSSAPAAFPPVPPLKVASIDIQRLFKGYYRTEEIQKELNVEQVAIKGESDARLETLRSIETELQNSARQLADPALAGSVKEKVAQDRALRREEAIALERARREFIDIKGKQINEKAAAQMRGIVAEIRKSIEDMARQEDYDYVFDRSGLTTSQVPFFLFSTESTDLTAAMLEKLNRDHSMQTKTGEATPDPLEGKD